MTRLRFALLSLALLAGLGAVTGRAQPGTGTGTAIAAPRRPGYQISSRPSAARARVSPGGRSSRSWRPT